MATIWLQVRGEGVSNNFDPLSLYRLAPVKKFWQWDFEQFLIRAFINKEAIIGREKWEVMIFSEFYVPSKTVEGEG